MLKPLIAGLVLLTAMEAAAAPPAWTEDLLGLTGTTLIFDSPEVRRQFGADTPPTDLENLAKQAGYHPWAGGRILTLLRKEHLQVFTPDEAFKAALERRNLMSVGATPDLLAALDKSLAAQPGTDITTIRRQLDTGGLDAVVLLTPEAQGMRWRLIGKDLQQSGLIESRGLAYLPHAWADSLALNAQWTELHQSALVNIRGLVNFAQFKSAETQLGAVCQQVRLLRLRGNDADFACQTANATVPERLALMPNLVSQPLLDTGLDEALMVGRQLGNRFAAYRWQVLHGAVSP